MLQFQYSHYMADFIMHNIETAFLYFDEAFTLLACGYSKTRYS